MSDRTTDTPPVGPAASPERPGAAACDLSSASWGWTPLDDAPASPVLPAWTYAPAPGIRIAFDGVMDPEGNLFWTEVTASDDFVEGVAPAALVSVTRDGVVRWRIAEPHPRARAVAFVDGVLLVRDPEAPTADGMRVHDATTGRLLDGNAAPALGDPQPRTDRWTFERVTDPESDTVPDLPSWIVWLESGTARGRVQLYDSGVTLATGETAVFGQTNRLLAVDLVRCAVLFDHTLEPYGPGWEQSGLYDSGRSSAPILTAEGILVAHQGFHVADLLGREVPEPAYVDEVGWGGRVVRRFAPPADTAYVGATALHAGRWFVLTDSFWAPGANVQAFDLGVAAAAEGWITLGGSFARERQPL